MSSRTDDKTSAGYEVLIVGRGLVLGNARASGISIGIGEELPDLRLNLLPLEQLPDWQCFGLTLRLIRSTRFMRQEFFEFTPQFKLWLAANARPAVDANDSGIWRRILLIPFTQEVPEKERDATVKERLSTDPDVQAAVPAWALRGCLLWQEHGLNPPAAVSAYTDEYREETDPLSEFFNSAASSTRSHGWQAGLSTRPTTAGRSSTHMHP